MVGSGGAETFFLNTRQPTASEAAWSESCERGMEITGGQMSILSRARRRGSRTA